MVLLKELLETQERQNEQVRAIVNDTAVNLSNAIYINLNMLNEAIPLTPAQKDELTSAMVLTHTLSAKLIELANYFAPIELHTVGLRAGLATLYEKTKQQTAFCIAYSANESIDDKIDPHVAGLLYRLTDFMFSYFRTLDSVVHINLTLHQNSAGQTVWETNVLFAEQYAICELPLYTKPASREKRLFQAFLIRMQQLEFLVKIAPDTNNQIWTIKVITP